MIRPKRFGPGLLVTAAFIGPGTVTTATAAGAAFGFALLWVVLFSVLATIILQEMSARLGLVTRRGLGEALRGTFPGKAARVFVAALIVSAILFGNAAFQTGNLTGAVMGLRALTGIAGSAWVGVIAIVAAAMLWTGAYKTIEGILIVLVGLMSVVFVLTACLSRPGADAVVSGLFVPKIPSGALTPMIALIGTTVVPYNLFLHASAVARKWTADTPVDRALSESRWDTVLAVALGGLVTMAIVVTAGTFYSGGEPITTAADMAQQLEPALGRWARSLFAVGLLSAGLTSAVTAPLAAAYATAGVLGWDTDLRSGRFRAVSIVVMVVGAVFAIILGGTPVSVIVFAQAANGFMLPIVAVFLLIVVNRRSILGAHVNGPIANVLGGAVVLLVSALGLYRILAALHKLG